MTEYGQSIPPRWFRDTTVKLFTRMNFAHYIHRALMQVGMIPIRSWNPFDLELPANADVNPLGDRSDYIWFYDFPTSESFTVDGIAYRPILVMTTLITYTGAISANQSSANTRFCLALRRAGDLAKNNLVWWTRNYENASPNFGFGTHNSTLTDTGTGNVNTGDSNGEYSGNGAILTKTDWKMFAASSEPSRQSLLAVRNFHVILGKGGLTVQVGSGLGRNDSNDLLSFSAVFGGARIPGRARIPAQDPNLNLMNPIVWLPHASTNVSSTHFYKTGLAYEGISYSGVKFSSVVLGIQHDLKIPRGSATGFTSQPGGAFLELFNLENIERPMFPVYATDTKNSPRNSLFGGVHILQPIVYTQVSDRAGVQGFVQVQDFNIRSEIAPTWFDIWYVPKFRISDRTAPIGEYVDPDTNLNWFLFRASNTNTILATEVEGITKFSTLGFFDSFTLVDDDYFNLNGGFTWTAGNPQQAAAVNSAADLWIPVGATDEATLTSTAGGTVANLTFTIEPYTGLAADESFTLQLELFWRSVSAQANSTSNPLLIEFSSDGTNWTTLQTIYNTGVTAGPYQGYTATAELGILPSSNDLRLRFRLRTIYTSSTGGTKTAGIRNIHVRRYERT